MVEYKQTLQKVGRLTPQSSFQTNSRAQVYIAHSGQITAILQYNGGRAKGSMGVIGTWFATKQEGDKNKLLIV